MNKMSKIFLCIIVILLIALGIVSFSYFRARKSAKSNLYYFFREKAKITELVKEYPELRDVDWDELNKKVDQMDYNWLNTNEKI